MTYGRVVEAAVSGNLLVILTRRAHSRDVSYTAIDAETLLPIRVGVLPLDGGGLPEFGFVDVVSPDAVTTPDGVVALYVGHYRCSTSWCSRQNFNRLFAARIDAYGAVSRAVTLRDGVDTVSGEYHDGAVAITGTGPLYAGWLRNQTYETVRLDFPVMLVPPSLASDGETLWMSWINARSHISVAALSGEALQEHEGDVVSAGYVGFASPTLAAGTSDQKLVVYVRDGILIGRMFSSRPPRGRPVR